jgi:phosphate uptake regulator
MLMLNHRLLALVLNTFAEEGDWEPIHEEIHELDNKINELEQNVRLAVLAHLAAPGQHDLPESLNLIRITQDAERIGDYGKNLYNLFRRFPEPQQNRCFDDFMEMRPLVLDGLLALRDGFAGGDATPVAEFLSEKDHWSKRCSEALDQLIAGTYNCLHPAACALAYRYFKRILGHMDHIAQAALRVHPGA